MELPIIEGVYRCSIRQSISGKNAVNVVHVEAETPETASDVATAVAKAWGDDLGPCLLQSTGVDLLGVDCTPLDGVSPTVSVGFGAAENDSGKHSAFTMPAGDAMCIGLKSETRGRRSNGRLFLSGLCTNQLENNQQSWLSATATAAGSAMEAFNAVLDTEIDGLQLVVATYGFNPVTEETWTPAAYHVVSFSPSTAVASQRRRDR